MARRSPPERVTARRRAIGAALLLLASLPCGPILFDIALPWTPVKLGYRSQTLGRATVYFHSSGTLRPEYLDIDKAMKEVEDFQGLRFITPVTIVVTADWAAFNRGTFMSLGATPRPVLGAALQTGTVIYLSPLERDPTRRPYRTVRHELSHALLYQHVSLRDSFALAREAWLLEGLATHVGNGEDYLTNREFQDVVQRTGHVFPIRERPDQSRISPDIYGRFMLTQYRRFIDYLIGLRGEESLRRFIRAAVANPRDVPGEFRTVYGSTLEVIGNEFARCLHKSCTLLRVNMPAPLDPVVFRPTGEGASGAGTP